MKLFLIRHGRPAADSHSGFPGPPLDNYGKKQAKKIKKVLSQKGITLSFHSDYTRVIETMAPFRDQFFQLEFCRVPQLREMEKSAETHESLTQRVQNWFINVYNQFQDFTAIFSHCGPANVILFYLDKEQTILKYPHKDEFGCLTPMGGIWELNISAGTLVNGNLIFNGKV